MYCVHLTVREKLLVFDLEKILEPDIKIFQLTSFSYFCYNFGVYILHSEQVFVCWEVHKETLGSCVLFLTPLFCLQHLTSPRNLVVINLIRQRNQNIQHDFGQTMVLTL